MYYGLAISLLVHGALLAWAMLSIHAAPERGAEPEPIAVALITPSELLRLKQGAETAKELEAKASEEPKPEVSKLEAEKPKPVLAPTPPAEAPPAEPEKSEPAKAEPPKPADPIAAKLAELPPPEPKEPEPAPGPTPEELKAEQEAKQKAEEEKKKAEEKRKAEEKKKAEAKKKAEEAKKKKLAEEKRKKEEEKKKASVADRLAALLDKDPTRKGAPTSATEPAKPTEYKGPTAGTATGNDTVLSVREQDLLRGMLRTQIARCWRLPGAGGGAETPVVTLRWRMRPDGTVDGEPIIEKSAGGPLGGLANEAALRAVKGCQPYDLPQDFYESGWKEVIWEFDPSDML